MLPCCQLVGEKRWERRRSSLDWFADGRDGSGSAADTTTVEVYDSASCQQYSLALSIATAAAALSVEPAELTRKKGRRRKLAPLWRKLARCVGFARDRPPGARPHLALVRTAADAARLHQKVAESAAETDAVRLRSRLRAAPRRRPRSRLQRSSSKLEPPFQSVNGPFQMWNPESLKKLLTFDEK